MLPRVRRVRQVCEDAAALLDKADLCMADWPSRALPSMPQNGVSLVSIRALFPVPGACAHVHARKRQQKLHDAQLV